MPEPKVVAAEETIEEAVEERIGEDGDAAEAEGSTEAASDGAEQESEADPSTEEQEIEAFRAMFGSGELEAEEQPASKPAQPAEPAPAFTGYKDVSKAEFDTIMETPEAYNKQRKEDYHNAVMEGVQKAVSYMNGVMEERLRVERIVSEFYDTYRDLRAHKPLVKAAIEQVRQQKPKASLAEVLVLAARATRGYVSSKNGSSNNATKRSTTLPNKSARQPAKRVVPNSQEARLKAFTQRLIGAK